MKRQARIEELSPDEIDQQNTMPTSPPAPLPPKRPYVPPLIRIGLGGV
jgi:hypothetical protein